MISKNFRVAFEETIGYEGGYVNNPNDPGGETKFGISKRSYPNLDIGKLRIEDAQEIYYSDFWIAIDLDKIINGKIAGEIFDTAVNMGKTTAIKIVQKSLNYLGESLIVDGIIGPITLSKINIWSRKDPTVFYKVLNGFQFMHYVEIINSSPSQKIFAQGWMKRIQNYREEV